MASGTNSSPAQSGWFLMRGRRWRRWHATSTAPSALAGRVEQARADRRKGKTALTSSNDAPASGFLVTKMWRVAWYQVKVILDLFAARLQQSSMFSLR